jgi:hypothetical protein
LTSTAERTIELRYHWPGLIEIIGVNDVSFTGIHNGCGDLATRPEWVSRTV